MTMGTAWEHHVNIIGTYEHHCLCLQTWRYYLLLWCVHTVSNNLLFVGTRTLLWDVHTIRDDRLRVLGRGHCCGVFTRAEVYRFTASRKTNVRRLPAKRMLRDPPTSIPAAAFLDLLGAQIADELLYTVSGDTQALV